jgi:hypothetical protein
VPKVVNPHIVESSSRSDALPGLLDADEVSVTASVLMQLLGTARSTGALRDITSRAVPDLFGVRSHALLCNVTILPVGGTSQNCAHDSMSLRRLSNKSPRR